MPPSVPPSVEAEDPATGLEPLSANVETFEVETGKLKQCNFLRDMGYLVFKAKLIEIG